MDRMDQNISNRQMGTEKSRVNGTFQETRSNSEIHHELKFYSTAEADRVRPKVTLRSDISDRMNRSWQPSESATPPSNLMSSKPKRQLVKLDFEVPQFYMTHNGVFTGHKLAQGALISPIQKNASNDSFLRFTSGTKPTESAKEANF